LVGVLCASSTVRAEEAEPEEEPALPSTVRLLLPACPATLFDRAVFMEALTVELIEDGVVVGGDGSEASPSRPSALITVDALSCERPILVVVLRRDQGGATSPETVDLTDRPHQDRARLLALTLAELVRSSWPSLAPTMSSPRSESSDRSDGALPTPAPLGDRDTCTTNPCPPVEIPVETTFRRSRLFGEVQLDARLYPSFHGSGIGARLGGWLRLSRELPFFLGLDGGYRFGEIAEELGQVVSHHVFGGLLVVVEGGGDVVRGHIGARLELGWARVTGLPLDDRAAGGRRDWPILTPTVSAGARFALGRGLWMVSTVEVGYVAVGLDVRVDDVSVEGHRAGGFGGMVIGLSVGVSYWPWSELTIPRSPSL
jgi:hypothetical protein